MSKIAPKSKTPLESVDLSDTDTEDESPVTLKTTENAKDSEAPQEELLKKKKPRVTRPLNEEMLMTPDGLLRIYEEFPSACRFHGRGSEAKDLKRLTTMYQEWAFQLHPGVAFPDFLIKCEQLGTKASSRVHLQGLRDRERDRYVTEVLGITRTTAQEAAQESNNAREREVTPSMHVQVPTEDSPPSASALVTPPSYEFLNAFSSARSSIVYNDEDEEFDEGDFLNMSADKGNGGSGNNNNDEDDERRFEEEMANFEDN